MALYNVHRACTILFAVTFLFDIIHKTYLYVIPGLVIPRFEKRM